MNGQNDFIAEFALTMFILSIGGLGLFILSLALRG